MIDKTCYGVVQVAPANYQPEPKPVKKQASEPVVKPSLSTQNLGSLLVAALPHARLTRTIRKEQKILKK